MDRKTAAYLKKLEKFAVDEARKAGLVCVIETDERGKFPMLTVRANTLQAKVIRMGRLERKVKVEK